MKNDEEIRKIYSAKSPPSEYQLKSVVCKWFRLCLFLIRCVVNRLFSGEWERHSHFFIHSELPLYNTSTRIHIYNSTRRHEIFLLSYRPERAMLLSAMKNCWSGLALVWFAIHAHNHPCTRMSALCMCANVCMCVCVNIDLKLYVDVI